MTKTRQILCIDPDPSELRIEALLNRRGIPVGLTQASLPHVIQEALSRRAWWDLILCDAASYRELDVATAPSGSSADNADASLILLQPREGEALTPAAAHRLGAADVVQRGDMDHLLMVCERELQNCATRKELRRLREEGASGALPTAPLMLATINDMGKTAKSIPPSPPAPEAGQAQPDTQVQAQIKALIDAGGLTLEFQPIISFQPQEEHRGMFEALVRLKDEGSGKILMPQEFLPVAERAGWMGKIDLWIFRRVLATLEQMQQGGYPDAVLFVNVATSTLASERLVEALGAFATTANLSPGSLVVEVRKSAFVEAGDGLGQLMKRLRAKHHGLLVEGAELDDCAFLARHRDLITHTKLDRAVAEGLAAGRVQQRALSGFVQCARREGVRIIALAVESAELLSMLVTSGVDAIQGHFVSQPYSDLVYPTVQQVEASSVARWDNRNH